MLQGLGQAKPDLTPRDDIKKMVSEILKRVDCHIRKNEFDLAEHLVAQAKEIDPKNIYAHAFGERIDLLKEQAHDNMLAEQACKPGISHVEEKNQPPIPLASELAIQNPATSKQVDDERCLEELRKKLEADFARKEQQRIREAAESARRMEEHRQTELRRRTEDEYNLKVQRMIKEAVESARREVEEKQSQLRAKEREELMQREETRVRETVELTRREVEEKQTKIRMNELEELAKKEQEKIKEAVQAARKAEEQRQMELRKRAEEELARRLHRENRETSIKDSLTINQAATGSVPSRPSKSTVIQSQPAPTQRSLTPARRETLSRYKLVLSSVWTDGAVTPEEDATLKQLRDSLSIDKEDHDRLEKEVKYETYIEAFKNAWNSGSITPENATILASLRDQFQISVEDHLMIEAKLLWEIQPIKNRPNLLIIDDDEKLLKLVTKSLVEAGFMTTSVATSDEAYAYLKDSVPDLILCDVNLESSTMGGFAFYEKVREMERLQKTPFIFLSGLTDEALVRTGKELGVDDYLSKPISEETLVSTIKGKIRRYQELTGRKN
jgi:CheY-like chemotaxis protein